MMKKCYPETGFYEQPNLIAQLNELYYEHILTPLLFEEVSYRELSESPEASHSVFSVFFL